MQIMIFRILFTRLKGSSRLALNSSSVCGNAIVSQVRLIGMTNEQARDDVLVEIGQGKLRGKVAKDYFGNNFYSFQGIPYAKAPVGKLRFRSPQPPEPWFGIWDATKLGPECPSTHMFYLYYLGKEDNCLNLNVYTKHIDKTKKRAVMVYIHGGAYVQGSNNTELFGPEYLMTEDIVLVIINYRLGVLGFLSLNDESLEVPGNAGLKDQVQALKWVQENIQKFGGDPENVTIFGESAGSACVQYLTLSPLTKGLIHKSIMQSGTALDVWSEGLRGADTITKLLGIKETDESKILQKLEKMSPRKLINAQMKFQETMEARQRRAFGPVIEKPHNGAFITQNPLQILKSGNYRNIPRIVGLNSNEGLLYIIARVIHNIKGPINPKYEIPHMIGLDPESKEAEEIGQKIKEFYKLDDKNTHNQNVWDLKADHHFVYGIHRTMDLLQKTSDQPIYYYLFDFDGKNNYFKKTAVAKNFYTYSIVTLLGIKLGPEFLKNIFKSLGTKMTFEKIDGVCHADDLGYLFSNIFTGTVEAGSREEKVSLRLVKLWTNFAKTGAPSSAKQTDDLINIEWKPITKEHHHCLKISDQLELIEDPFKKRNEFWDNIYEKYDN